MKSGGTRCLESEMNVLHHLAALGTPEIRGPRKSLCAERFLFRGRLCSNSSLKAGRRVSAREAIQELRDLLEVLAHRAESATHVHHHEMLLM